MGHIARVRDVNEAVDLTAKLRDAGEYDWFRGQVKNYPLVASFARRSETDREAALEKFGRFEHWVSAALRASKS